jgi:hypothetical protein
MCKRITHDNGSIAMLQEVPLGSQYTKHCDSRTCISQKFHNSNKYCFFHYPKWSCHVVMEWIKGAPPSPSSSSPSSPSSSSSQINKKRRASTPIISTTPSQQKVRATASKARTTKRSLNEQAILKPIISRQTHHIPHGVGYWLFFKTHILEKPTKRAAFQVSPTLTRPEFFALVRKLASPRKYGPRTCTDYRLTNSSRERYTSDLLAVIWPYYLILLAPTSPIFVQPSTIGAGLGVFVRRQVLLKTGATLLPTFLWGSLNQIPDEHFTSLATRNYPSLYSSGTTLAILVGPLSLVNHRCASKLVFTPPRVKLPFEEFSGLKGVLARASSAVTLDASEEIFVDYGMEAKDRSWKCCCDSCSRTA